MISNNTSEIFKNVYKIHIIKSKDVFYPLQHVLQKKNLVFDERSVLTIKPLPEDLRYPASSKLTDSGQTTTYKISLSVVDQEPQTEEQLMEYLNQNVILVFDYFNTGRCIIGCNENPLFILLEDNNASSALQDHGFSVEIAGTTYFAKVNR